MIIGTFLLLGQLGAPVHGAQLWPFILLVPGCFFWWHFYVHRREQPGLLFPGTILVLYSLYFFLNQLTGYRYAGQTSFIFTLGVALGFFAMYYFSSVRRRVFFILAWIMTVISLITAVSTIAGKLWWPILLITTGALLLTRRNQSSSQPEHDSIVPPANNK